MITALWCLLGCSIVQAVALAAVGRTLSRMSASFDALRSEAAACVALMAHAVDVITRLVAKVGNAVDSAEVDAVTASLKAGADALSAAADAAEPPAG